MRADSICACQISSASCSTQPRFGNALRWDATAIASRSPCLVVKRCTSAGCAFVEGENVWHSYNETTCSSAGKNLTDSLLKNV